MFHTQLAPRLAYSPLSIVIPQKQLSGDYGAYKIDQKVPILYNVDKHFHILITQESNLKEIPNLSGTDRKLLVALKQDSRASITTLAALLSVSRATVQASIKRLIDNSVIQRFTIDINDAVERDLVRAVMTIEVEGVRTSEIIMKLKKMPEIISLHSTNGSWDLVANIETPDLMEFDGLLRRTREIPGILNSETSILLNAAK